MPQKPAASTASSAPGKATPEAGTALEPNPAKDTSPAKATGPAKDGPTTNGPAKDSPAKDGADKKATPSPNPKDKQPGKGSALDGMAAPSVTAAALASRHSQPRGLRKANPARMARGTTEWAKRPTGRFVLPAVVAVLLLGAAGTAGAYLVPQALDAAPAPSATPGFGQDAAIASGSVPASAPAAPLPSVSVPTGITTPPVIGGGLPTGTTTTAPGTVPGAVTGGTTTGGRPADQLNGWAQQVGTRLGVPVVAVQAYGYAQLVMARRAPSCHLTWTTIAGIGLVESAHGSAQNAVLGADGTVTPPIYGLPLNGEGGRQVIRDTDQGVLDKDPTFDRAIGPLQFIPQTWNELATGNAVDADNNGVSDPNDIDDAALAAGVYLCKNGRDLAKPDAWWEAILSYNAVRPYAQKVYDTANSYGELSRG